MPRFTGIEPAVGSLEGETLVTLTGNGFHKEETEVRIGDNDCVIVTATPSKVVCSTPANQIGTFDVVVSAKNIVNFGEGITFAYDEEHTPSVTR